MAKTKQRKDIPKEVAAKVLFLADRTCCVCRQKGKPIQIHHIDENPSNNHQSNLAVLCFECHHDTQVKGGFDRKLDADTVILYRNDWTRLVERKRSVADEVRRNPEEGPTYQLALATSLAEIYRENENYEELALHYHRIGNSELRDKYIELAISKDPSDSTVCFLRARQGRPDLIPEEVVSRRLTLLERDPLQRGRFFVDLGKYLEAARDYVQGVKETLDDNNIFSTAFYLKEMFEAGVVNELFQLALKEAQEEHSLWWQVRALEELGWKSELRELLLEHCQEIELSGTGALRAKLAWAKGDKAEQARLAKEHAATRVLIRKKKAR